MKIFNRSTMIFLVSLFMISSVATAQNINLPKPKFQNNTLSVTDALASRHSSRTFSNKKLSLQEISNLCWAACGVARDNEHRTAPTARNLKEIQLFVFTENAVYEYDAVSNSLILKAKGDHRSSIAGRQEFAKTAPISLLMVINFDKMGENNQRNLMMGCVDVGNVSENINLYCQAVGLATVPRATMNNEAIIKLLNLNKNQLPILNNPVGYSK